jgi:hypothetical protein
MKLAQPPGECAKISFQHSGASRAADKHYIVKSSNTKLPRNTPFHKAKEDINGWKNIQVGLPAHFHAMRNVV